MMNMELLARLAPPSIYQYQNNVSGEISSHKNSAEIIDRKLDDNGINLVNTGEEAGITSIHYTNKTNDISMNEYDNYTHKYYASFLSSNNHGDVSSGLEYDSAKQRVCHQKYIILDLLFKK